MLEHLDSIAQAIHDHGVVPDVIPRGFSPSVELSIQYDSGVACELGNVLTPTQVQNPPSFSYEANPESLYSIIMTDPDAPSRANPIRGEWHHYWVGNIPGNDVSSGETISEYVGSGPPKDTGLHRYVFLLCEQPGPIVPQQRFALKPDGRNNTKAMNFVEEHNMKVVGINFYQAEYDDYVPILYSKLNAKNTPHRPHDIPIEIASSPSSLSRSPTVIQHIITFITRFALFLISFVERVWSEVRLVWNARERRRRALASARTLEEWSLIASRIDEEEGSLYWKTRRESKYYDHRLIQHTVDRLRYLRKTENIRGLVWELRACTHRNFGGIAHPRLHGRALIGTKLLVEEFVDEMCSSINDVTLTSDAYLPIERRIEFIRELVHAHGRTALLLSGGASFAMFHLGVVKCLWESQLLPRIISGSSAGSIIASIICVRNDAELPFIFHPNTLDLRAFVAENENLSVGQRIYRLLSQGAAFNVLNLQRCLQNNLGNCTFREAYEHSGRILNITVTSTTKFSMPSLLNYLTAPNVMIWSAACASCALPGVFAPVTLMAKDEDGNTVPYLSHEVKWEDGSVEADLPMARLAELFNVNHFLVSQANPHVIPFVSETPQQSVSCLSRISHWVLSELRHRILQLFEYNLVSRRFAWLQTLITQRYEGDCTIIPDVSMADYLHLFSNPTHEFIERSIAHGDRKTWPKLSYLRTQIRIEHHLNETLRLLSRSLSPTIRRRDRLTRSPWAKYPWSESESNTTPSSPTEDPERDSTSASISKFFSFDPDTPLENSSTFAPQNVLPIVSALNASMEHRNSLSEDLHSSAIGPNNRRRRFHMLPTIESSAHSWKNGFRSAPASPSNYSPVLFGRVDVAYPPDLADAFENSSRQPSDFPVENRHSEYDDDVTSNRNSHLDEPLRTNPRIGSPEDESFHSLQTIAQEDGMPRILDSRLAADVSSHFDPKSDLIPRSRDFKDQHRQPRRPRTSPPSWMSSSSDDEHVLSGEETWSQRSPLLSTLPDHVACSLSLEPFTDSLVGTSVASDACRKRSVPKSLARKRAERSSPMESFHYDADPTGMDSTEEDESFDFCGLRRRRTPKSALSTSLTTSAPHPGEVDDVSSSFSRVIPSRRHVVSNSFHREMDASTRIPSSLPSTRLLPLVSSRTSVLPDSDPVSTETRFNDACDHHGSSTHSSVTSSPPLSNSRPSSALDMTVFDM